MLKLSVVLATHNEEKNIVRCLESVKGLADEVIIVDGESTDKTVDLAKKMGARVIETTNKTNFHINKQMAMDQAKGDLVLQLDADEVIDKELYHFILELKKSPDKENDISAWWLRRKNFFLGIFLRKGGQYPDPSIRLYRRGKARLPQKDVHEVMIVDGKVGWAEGHQLHYGNPTFADYLRKFNTYTTFRAEQLQEKNVRINIVHSIDYLLWKPFATFFSIFLRHRGYVDGVPGFVFAVFSGLIHSVSYLKLWEMSEKHNLGAI